MYTRFIADDIPNWYTSELFIEKQQLLRQKLSLQLFTEKDFTEVRTLTRYFLCTDPQDTLETYTRLLHISPDGFLLAQKKQLEANIQAFDKDGLRNTEKKSKYLKSPGIQQALYACCIRLIHKDTAISAAQLYLLLGTSDVKDFFSESLLAATKKWLHHALNKKIFEDISCFFNIIPAMCQILAANKAIHTHIYTTTITCFKIGQIKDGLLLYKLFAQQAKPILKHAQLVGVLHEALAVVLYERDLEQLKQLIVFCQENNINCHYKKLSYIGQQEFINILLDYHFDDFFTFSTLCYYFIERTPSEHTTIVQEIKNAEDPGFYNKMNAKLTNAYSKVYAPLIRKLRTVPSAGEGYTFDPFASN